MATIQIVLVDDNMPATEEYGDYRGYAVEVNGIYESEAANFEDAQQLARELAGDPTATWREARYPDGRGVRVWDQAQ